MTVAQQLLLQAFREDLLVRGVELEIGSIVVTAIVEPIPPEEKQFYRRREEREMSRVHVAREDITEAVEVGSFFEDAEGSSHRVIEISDHPTNVKVIFTCETS